MVNQSFKMYMLGLCGQYAFFERQVFIITSVITELVVLLLLQPISPHIFNPITTPEVIYGQIAVGVLSVLGIFYFSHTFGENDIFGIGKTKYMSSGVVEYPIKTKSSSNGILDLGLYLM
jgi:hypothetical protein